MLPYEPSPAQSHLFMKYEARIRGLPDGLQVVPHDPEKWRMWAKAIGSYREQRRRACERDGRQQAIEYEKCRRDTAYFITVWLPIFEARTTDGKPPGWRPFILFPFQVQMVRWIEYVLSLEIETSNGRSDGVVEKSRDMGATYIFCAVFVKHFIFDETFIAGFISKRFEDVDKNKASGTIFYKLRSMLGAEDAVPKYLAVPPFLLPKGFDKESHIATGAIVNPEPGKTCFLVGETTTSLSGVSDRLTVRLIDEAARFTEFPNSWTNQQATTDHRFALSTASLQFGDTFYRMARLAEEGLISPEKEGPSLLRLEYSLHPFHTPSWFAGQRARAASSADPNEFTREYEINYFAERGSKVYPRFEAIQTEHCPYDPMGGPLYCWIDPGTRDPTAIVWAQIDSRKEGINIVNSFEGRGGEDVYFYASVLLGVYLSGERQYNYDEYPGIHEVMEFTASIDQPITYVGDPAGTQRGGRGDERSTFYQELTLASREIGSRTIFVQTITANNARSYEARKQAVNLFTPVLHFHNNRGGSRVLFCMQKSAYKKSTTQREVLEPSIPEHSPESHIRTCVEYGMVWMKFQQQQAQRQRERVNQPIQRRSMSGNIVSGRQKNMFDRSVRTGRRDGSPW